MWSYRDRLDAEIRRLSAGRSPNEIGIDDIFRLVNSLNHISLLIRKGFISGDAARSFDPVIAGLWPLLKPLVYYERKRRETENKPLAERYANSFEIPGQKLTPMHQNGAQQT